MSHCLLLGNIAQYDVIGALGFPVLGPELSALFTTDVAA